jgi:O-acetyl-ADP-ribose deacetylase (regulator of RNase III)
MTECSKLNGCETGQTKLTSGHSLPSKHVAHTVGPIYHSQGKKESEKLLRSCYRTTLELCEEEGIKSVAFSGISTGIYGYPKDDAARVACDEARKFLDSEKGANVSYLVRFRSLQPQDLAVID